VLETPQGNKIAWANIVAAAGSGVIVDTYHPGRESGRSGALNLVGLNLPDVKYFVRHRILPFPYHRLVTGKPAVSKDEIPRVDLLVPVGIQHP